MDKTCYQLLSVSSAASSAEIRRAFRRQIRRCHPDTATPGAADEAHFQKLLAAYRLLSSPSRRSQYDAQLAKSRSVSSGFLLRILRKFFRAQWQWMQACLSPCTSRPSVRSSTVRYRPTPIKTPSRDRHCWPTFSQVLAARQQVESTRYVLCEDGIIRPKNGAVEREQQRPLPTRRSSMAVSLRGWWLAVGKCSGDKLNVRKDVDESA